MNALIKDLFSTAVFNETSISFPEDASREVFLKTKKMLSDIGGSWVGGKFPRFQFEYNPKSIVDKFIADNSWPKKNKFSFFPTPKNVIDYIVKYSNAAPEFFSHVEGKVRILEPSAGRGNLAIALRDAYIDAGIDVEIVCVEIDPINVGYLKKEGFTVIEKDFLSLTVEELGMFNVVVMNPPFNGTECAEHVRHAQNFLPKFRFVVAVLPTTLFTHPYKKSIDLCHDISILNMGDFDECVFDGGTFDKTKVETMVVNFPSGDINAEEKTLAYELYAEFISNFIRNDNLTNFEFNQSKSLSDTKSKLNHFCNSRKNSDLRFIIINDAVQQICAESLFSCIEPLDTYTPPVKRPENAKKTEELALEDGAEKISSLLEEIGDVLNTSAA